MGGAVICLPHTTLELPSPFPTILLIEKKHEQQHPGRAKFPGKYLYTPTKWTVLVQGNIHLIKVCTFWMIERYGASTHVLKIYRL